MKKPSTKVTTMKPATLILVEKVTGPLMPSTTYWVGG